MIDPKSVKVMPTGKIFRSTTGLAEDTRIPLMAAMAGVELGWMIQEARGNLVLHATRRKIAELSQLLKESIGADDPNMSLLCSDPFGLHVLISVLSDLDPPLVVNTAPEVVTHIAMFAEQLATSVFVDAQNADVVLLSSLKCFCMRLSEHSRVACAAFSPRRGW